MFGRVELTAVRITLIYVVFGMFALVLSDVVFVQYFSDPLLSQIQALKGGVEVVVTAGLIFLLTHRSRRQLQDAHDRVERQRDELRLLHRVFRHNLRNHLNVILGYADLIKTEIDEQSVTEQCDLISDSSERILAYIETASQIRTVSVDDRHVRTVDLAQTIQLVLDELPDVHDHVGVTNTIPMGIEVRANSMLDEALKELVTNAITHNDAKSPTVTIELLPDADSSRMAAFRIRDNGPGIPESETEALRRDRETQLLHSTGMGLWFVDWVVSHSHGELTIQRANDRGTEVHVRLPLAPTSPIPTRFSMMSAQESRK